MPKLTTKKLRLLFCDVVEQFIPLFNQKELEKGIETERLADFIAKNAIILRTSCIVIVGKI